MVNVAMPNVAAPVQLQSNIQKHLSYVGKKIAQISLQN
jgi:hypothetical protein